MSKQHKKSGHVKDLKGEKFGRLLVLSYAGISEKRPLSLWKCICDCGNETTLPGVRLSSGHTKSCGCLKSKTHGLSGTKIYEVWRAMKARCLNKNNKFYSSYGGRGISVCNEWLSFDNFYSDMGDKPKGKSLDRIDNDGDYTPENCRWATCRQQQWNTRATRMITHKGKSFPLKEWARQIGIDPSALRYRLKNWTLKEAIEGKDANQ